MRSPRSGPVRLILLALLVLVAPGIAQASPLTTVQAATETVLGSLRSPQTQDDPALAVAIDQAIEPFVDFPRMARLVLGKHWRRATPLQQESFTREFRHLLVSFYTDALDEFVASRADTSGIDITFFPPQEDADGTTATVRSRIQQPEGNAISVIYDLYRQEEGWKVYDVTVEGISLVLNYRSSFSDLIRRNGIEGLIRQLSERNASI